MNFFLQNASKKRGFTLIETLVAVTILAFAVAGPLYSASRAYSAAQTAREKLTATYLAQEGIEYVRQMRDDAYLDAYRAGLADPSLNVATVAWNSFTTGAGPFSISPCRTPATCKLDPVQPESLTPCSGATCTPLYLSAAGVYTQQSAGGSQTLYTRTIQSVQVSATEEQITSTVTWNSHGSQSVSITVHLTPWQ